MLSHNRALVFIGSTEDMVKQYLLFQRFTVSKSGGVLRFVPIVTVECGMLQMHFVFAKYYCTRANSITLYCA
jgi:hypothetical protein